MDYNKIQPVLELYGPVPQSEGKLAGAFSTATLYKLSICNNIVFL